MIATVRYSKDIERAWKVDNSSKLQFLNNSLYYTIGYTKLNEYIILVIEVMY